VDIGRVVAPIKAGEHLHVHNVKTKRWWVEHISESRKNNHDW
jgi:hypothetical protein